VVLQELLELGHRRRALDRAAERGQRGGPLGLQHIPQRLLERGRVAAGRAACAAAGGPLGSCRVGLDTRTAVRMRGRTARATLEG